MSGGSAKPKRRKAATGGLQYEPVRGRVPVSSPDRRETRETRGPRVSWDSVLRWALIVVLVAAIGALTFVERAWGDEIWGDVAPAWPGGPYGLAATTGVLVPLAVAHLVVTLTRVKWPQDKAGSLGWIGASLPGAALTALLLVVAFAAKKPKRLSGFSCYEEGGACRLQDEYPYIWGVGWGAVLVTAAVLAGGRVVYRRRVAAASDADSSARPVTRRSTSGPPDPPRPRCPSRSGGRRRAGSGGPRGGRSCTRRWSTAWRCWWR